MKVNRSDRGFAHFGHIEGHQGGLAKTYESSLATEACIWLSVDDPDGHVAHVQLTLSDAKKLAKQLRWLARHHYQLPK